MDFGHLFHIPNGFDATFWAFVALLLFLALLLKLDVPAKAAKALDDRAAAIEKELDEAKRLRLEAQELLASFQRKQREAEAEAAGIVAQAQRDAASLAAETRAKIAAQLERRAQIAERKIAQAEADAAAAIRARAADLAAAAAERLLADGIGAEAQGRLIASGTAELESRFKVS